MPRAAPGIPPASHENSESRDGTLIRELAEDDARAVAANYAGRAPRSPAGPSFRCPIALPSLKKFKGCLNQEEDLAATLSREPENPSRNRATN